jgi:prepilin-type N-terminal cleavage/methylation domain-containing protein
MHRPLHRTHAFTLIELLVVVAIITLLVGITTPALRSARESARRTVCQKNLATIGFGIQDYLLQNNETFFTARRMRHDEELRAAADPGYVERPSLPTVLARQLRGKSEVFLCPSDKNTKSLGYVPTDRYYDYEDSSYEWETTLEGRRLHTRGVIFRIGSNFELFRSRDLWMVSDFEPFHGPSGREGMLNSLYADMRVVTIRVDRF